MRHLVLSPLEKGAEDTDVAIVLVRHLNKAQGLSAKYRGGSIGWIGGAHSALLVAEDPGDPELRVLAQAKTNLGRQAPPLSFRVAPPTEELGEPGSGTRAPTIEWLGRSLKAYTADELVNQRRGGPRRRTRRNWARPRSSCARSWPMGLALATPSSAWPRSS